MSLFPNGGCLALEHNFSSGSQASWDEPSVRTSATQTRAEWWLLDAEWHALHMLCRELFSLLNFLIFKGSLKAISVPIVSCSSCITSPKLSVLAGPTFWQIIVSQGTKFFQHGPRDLQQEEDFCYSTSVPGRPCCFFAKFWLIPWPCDNLPSHLLFIQTYPPTHQAAAALSSVSLSFHCGKVKWQGLFFLIIDAAFEKSFSCFFHFLCILLPVQKQFPTLSTK